jgi:hypothetical protein
MEYGFGVIIGGVQKYYFPIYMVMVMIMIVISHIPFILSQFFPFLDFLTTCLFA